MDPELTDFLDEDGSVPKCFNKDKLPPLHRDGIAWWDEVHTECFIGNFRKGSRTQTRFCRTPDGSYNPDGKFCDKNTKFMVKFPK